MSLSRISGPSALVRRRSRSRTFPVAHAHQSFPSTAFSRSTSAASGPSEISMIFPRRSNYERLESGLGPSRLGILNIAWKRVVVCLAVIVGALWLLRPSENRVWNIKTPGKPHPLTFSHASIVVCNCYIVNAKDWNILISISFTAWQAPEEVDTDHAPPLPMPPVKPHKPEMNEAPATPTPVSSHLPRPSSYESDPDPSKTVFCTIPHSPSLPLVQYALMIDAGSTGSRIHVYKFHNCGPSTAYEYETFVQRQPGLSAYAGHPDEAAMSLDSLLDVAVRTVPEALRRCTPVTVKATAGLRLLGASQSAEILEAVRRRLSEVYPFPLASQDPVAIMDGRDEGVFAWVTANYLMDTIRADSPATAVPYAVLDLGGASTQIVFEPVFDDLPDSALREGDHKYELSFGAREHVLYQHSYLGFGLMHARKSVHRLVDFMASHRTSAAGDGNYEIANPCLARGTRRTVEVEVGGPDSATKKNVTMFGGDVGSFEACNRVVQLVMVKDA